MRRQKTTPEIVARKWCRIANKVYLFSIGSGKHVRLENGVIEHSPQYATSGFRAFIQPFISDI